MAISAPYLPYDRLRELASDFLREHHPKGDVPVPIEEIVEFRFNLDIVPTPGLHDHFEIDSYITSDLSAIHVDSHVYERISTRYRFSLAHEMAHVVLHQDVFAQLRFVSIEGWKKAVSSIPPTEYSWLEWQAYSFAGLVLVPPEQLRSEFDARIAEAKRYGADLFRGTERERGILESHLGRHFDVSLPVIQKRLKYDELWTAR